MKRSVNFVMRGDSPAGVCDDFDAVPVAVCDDFDSACRVMRDLAIARGDGWPSPVYWTTELDADSERAKQLEAQLESQLQQGMN